MQFKGEKVDRWFPVTINWDTDQVKRRDFDEQLTGEYGRGRILERIDYQKTSRLATEDLDLYMKELHPDHPQDERNDSGALPHPKRQSFLCLMLRLLSQESDGT